MYADYIYYTQTFAGTLVPAEEYPSFARKVENYINYITSHKISKDNVPEEVRIAVCTTVEELYILYQSRSNIPQGVKSENTDGYSVTYADFDFNKFRENEKQVMHDTIVELLSDTGLLYRGVC